MTHQHCLASFFLLASSLYGYAQCPVSDFLDFSVSSPRCLGLPVSFTDFQPSTNGDTFEVIIGTDTLASAPYEYTFSTSGEKTVTLRRLTDEGCSMVQKTFLVSTLPTGAFTFGADNANPRCADKPVTFESTVSEAVNYVWDFDDGGSSTSANPSHTFDSKGGDIESFAVQLTISAQSSGCVNSLTEQVSVKALPKIRLTDEFGGEINRFENCENASTANPGFTISFLDRSESDAQSYRVDWGDGEPVHNGGSAPNGHEYGSMGIYTIAYTVTGPNGCLATEDYLVYNISNPSIGSANPGGTIGCAPFSVDFQITNYEGNHSTTQYVIDAGDDTSLDTLPHPPPAIYTHEYQKNSCDEIDEFYEFTITAVNGCTPTNSSNSPIRIFSPPKAALSANQKIVCVGESLTFQNTSTDGTNSNCSTNARYTWDYGDGTSDIRLDKNSVTHTYSSAGTYTVQLEAENQRCGVTTESIEVEVCDESPLSSFTATFNSISKPSGSCESSVIELTLPEAECTPLTVDLINTSTLPCSAKVRWSVDAAGGCGFSGGGLESFIPDESISFTAGGTYFLTYLVENACGFSESCITIVVNDAPERAIIVNANSTYCETELIDLSASDTERADTYSWSIVGIQGTADPVLAIDLNQQDLAPFQLPSGHYEAELSVSNLCGSVTASATFDVGKSPDLSIVPGDKTICEGDQLTLNTVGDIANSFQWIKDDVDIPGAVSSEYVVSEAGNYRVRAALNGCSRESSGVTISVTASPSVSMTTSDPLTFCTEQEISVAFRATENPLYVYQWFLDGDSLRDETRSSLTASEIGTYYVAASVMTCIGTSSNLSITQLASPTLATDDDDPMICTGDSISLEVSGASVYEWAPSFGLDQTEGPAVRASPSRDTVYTVVGSNASGCKDTVRIEITVSALPSVVVAAEDSEICFGSSTFLEVTGAQAYRWEPAESLDVSVWSRVEASPFATTTYEVVGTDGFGCRDTAQVQILVAALPSVDISTTGPTEFCPEDVISVRLQAIENASLNYLWQKDEEDLPGADSAVLIVIEPGTYRVQVNDEKCGNISNSISVVRLPPPNLTALDDRPAICLGDSITLEVAGAQRYEWLPADGLSTSEGPAVRASPLDDTEYKILGFNGSGCRDTITLSLSVNDLPDVSASASVNPICFGELTNLTASGAEVYHWSPGEALDTSEGSSVMAGPRATTTYLVVGQNAFGCLDTARVAVEVSSLPIIEAGDNMQICQNEMPVHLLEKSDVNTNEGTWSGPNVVSNIFDPAMVNVGAYQVVYEITESATGCTNSDSIAIEVKEVPAPRFQVDDRVCSGSGITFQNLTPSVSDHALSYRWDFGDGDDSDVSTPMHVFDEPGIYEVVLKAETSPGLCQMSDTLSIEAVAPPAAHFDKINLTTTCGPLDLELQNNSTGTLISYQWDFGNGQTSTEADPPSVRYVSNPLGDTVYYIRLEVQSAVSSCPSQEYNDSITISSNPTSNFLFAMDPICADFPASMNNFSFGNPDHFIWDFGDGSDPLTTNRTGTVQHVFRNEGLMDTTYQVSLIAVNQCYRDTSITAITVRPNQVDAFYFTDTLQGCSPLTATFTSNQVPGTSNDIFWDFGDGSPIVTDSIYVSHTFDSVGTFFPRLVIRNGCNIDTCQTGDALGCGAVITTLDSPTASFGATSSICDGTEAIFTNESSSLINSRWDFGDGNSYLGAHPAGHAFSSPGNYDVSLVVQGINGCDSEPYMTPVEVRPLPQSSFVITGDTFCEGDTVSFSNSSSGARSYLWKVSSGVESIRETGTFAFPRPGRYSVTLAAYDLDGQSGCEDSTTLGILIGEVPVPTFEAVVDISCTNSEVHLINSTTIPSKDNGEFLWTLDSIIWRVYQPGAYQVSEGILRTGGTLQATLQVVHANGCSGSLSQSISIPALQQGVVGLPRGNPLIALTPGYPPNDEFRLLTENIDSTRFEMSIFNQWGNRLFSTDNPSDTWDGFYKGEVSPPGTYIARVKTVGCRDRSPEVVNVPVVIINKEP